MKNPALFYGGIALLVIGILLGIFFLVPGVNHIITDSRMHIKHATACFVLAALGLIVALVNRPKAGTDALMPDNRVQDRERVW